MLESIKNNAVPIAMVLIGAGALYLAAKASGQPTVVNTFPRVTAVPREGQQSGDAYTEERIARLNAAASGFDSILQYQINREQSDTMLKLAKLYGNGNSGQSRYYPSLPFGF